VQVCDSDGPANITRDFVGVYVEDDDLIVTDFTSKVATNL